MENKIKGFYMPKETSNKLEELKKETGMSKSLLIRSFIDFFHDKKGLFEIKQTHVKFKA